MKKVVLICLSILSFNFLFPNIAFSDNKQTAFERVMETGKLRCAFLVWPPIMEIDPNSGEFSGMNYDMTMALAKSLGLEVEWAIEIAPGDQVEVLRTGKADAICTADGPFNPSAARYLQYSEAISYVPLYAYVRTDDERFTETDLSILNKEDIKFSVIDGDIVDMAAENFFPKAQRMPLQHLSAPGQMMLDVMTKKADALVNDPMTMTDFDANNPNKIRRYSDEPLVVIPNTFTILRTQDSDALQDLLNEGLRSVYRYGYAKNIMKKYPQGVLYEPAKPYIQE